MNDVSVKELIEKVQAFCEERDWDQFHNPKDLAIGISTEANELLDIFRFKSDEQQKALLTDEKSRGHIQEELADVLFFVLRFAQMNDMDLKACLEDKMEKNGKKYPADKVRGKNLKYTELQKDQEMSNEIIKSCE